MENKRGQFYIITAIIIVVVISTLASVVTYVVINPEPRVMKDISDNLKEESARLIDYGIYNGEDVVSLQDNFAKEDFAEYILEKTNNANVTFVYGNRTNLTMVQYSMGGYPGTCIGESCVTINPINVIITPIEISLSEDYIIVNMLGKEYSFKLRDNQMFYFVITKENEGEVFVEDNQEFNQKVN